jgi:uncharacterized protein YdhG (YjbR/CyaY superfamily)
MVSSAATTVKQYLEELPADRRAVVAEVRAALRKAMPKGYEEAMNWGMITWQVPLARYPDTYNGQPLAYAALAAQKNNYALYLMGCYGDARQEKALRAAYEKLGKKPDMGKSCVRFRKLEDLPLEAIAKLVAGMGVEDYLAHYEKSRAARK